jgi:hypothetical protein
MAQQDRKMLLSFAIWMVEAAAAAAISAAVTGVAFLVGITMWLHGGPKHEAKGDLQPLYAVDDHARDG